MMADSAPKVAPEERQEAANTLDNKAQTLANQIKKSKHFIAFTGAGISTSAGMLPVFFAQHYLKVSQVSRISEAQKAHGR